MSTTTDLTIDRIATAARLLQSLETIEWAASILPPQWAHALPDAYPPGDWTVAMNIAHLVVYEEELGLPVLRALADGGDATGVTRANLPAWFEPDAAALSSHPLAELVGRLDHVRRKQIAVVDSFDATRWDAPVCALWTGSGRHGSGPQSAAWVASKTFQHSWEHGNAVLRMALFAPR